MGSQKVDICFYGALKNQIDIQKCQMGFYIVRFLTAGSFFVTHLMNKDTNDENTSRMVVWLFVMMLIFNLAAFLYTFWVHNKFLTNSRLINVIADKIQHSQIID